MPATVFSKNFTVSHSFRQLFVMPQHWPSSLTISRIVLLHAFPIKRIEIVSSSSLTLRSFPFFAHSRIR